MLSLPLALVFVEKLQSRIITAKSLMARITLVSVLILSAVMGKIVGSIDWVALRHRQRHQEPSRNDERKIEHRNYRPTVDEPGEFKA